ncbi:hypothetical protein MKW98_030200 [Papaver atlanticum]|uniref:CRAL-TRIO domain-containing protein n=1 Tax=Papaver atlanticum TaxID=357466 RepID=A0AAD4STQ0_9MAGN|nr:hypothetical protein MKW98_030200 [Papaver atlanticum]
MGVNSKIASSDDTEKKALDELKQLIKTALINHEFTSPSPHKPIKEEEVFIWGIPLIGDEKSDVILLKFLRASDFKVKKAFTTIKKTVKWRKECGIDTLLDEDLGLSNDLEKVVFMNGFDKKGHPVCYNAYGEFESNKDLYSKTFSTEEKRLKFIIWRIQFLEKSIRKLDFGPGGVSTILQICDLKNSPGVGTLELIRDTDQSLCLIQENYPEFHAKHVLINVPWWYHAFYRMVSPFLPQRTKSKFVFAGPSKSPKTLFKYISPGLVPVQYGGLYREGNKEFSCADLVEEIPDKRGTRKPIELLVSKIRCVFHITYLLQIINYLGKMFDSSIYLDVPKTSISRLYFKI